MMYLYLLILVIIIDINLYNKNLRNIHFYIDVHAPFHYWIIESRDTSKIFQKINLKCELIHFHVIEYDQILLLPDLSCIGTLIIHSYFVVNHAAITSLLILCVLLIRYEIMEAPCKIIFTLPGRHAIGGVDG